MTPILDAFPDLWASDSLFVFAAPYFGLTFAIACARYAVAVGVTTRR